MSLRGIQQLVVLREFSLHTCLMLLAFTTTLAVDPYSRDEFPFSSAEEFLQFKVAMQDKYMRCTLETVQIDDWIRYEPTCYFGGYRPTGPETGL